MSFYYGFPIGSSVQRVQEQASLTLLGHEIKYLPQGNVLEIVGSITVFELLSIVGFAFFLVTVGIAVKNSADVATTRRAEFSFRIWEAFMREDIQKAYLEIEWEKFKYPYDTEKGFESEEQEKNVDRLLYLLEEIAFLRSSGVLTSRDVDRWAYQGRRVFRNEGIKNYLEILDDWFEKQGRRVRPHDKARKLFNS